MKKGKKNYSRFLAQLAPHRLNYDPTPTPKLPPILWKMMKMT